MSDSDRTTETDPAVRPHDALGKTVGGGMTRMFLATVIAKLATMVAQGMLGWWLLPNEFRSFALATAAAGFIMLARDACIPNWLIQKGAHDHDRNAGPGFYIALAYNLIAALVMGLAAYPLAHYWANEPKVGPMLIVIAISLPIGTPGTVSQAKLRSMLEFRKLTMLLTVSGVLRQIFTVLLAWFGMGEMSFAIPVVLTALFESIATPIVADDRPWKLSPQFDRWREIFAEAWLLTQATVANFATDWGPYLVLPFFMSDEEGKKHTGYYFWGYMLLGQIAALLSNNLFVIILPALTRLRDEPARLAQAFLRALRVVMFAACSSSVLLASMIVPLEHLIWRGKWSETTQAIMLLTIFFPWKATFGLTSATFMAVNRSRRFSIMTWIEGAILMIAAVIVSIRHPHVDMLVTYIGAALMLGRVLSMIVLMKTLGHHSRTLAYVSVPAWIVGLIAGAAGALAEHFASIQIRAFEWIPALGVFNEYTPLTELAGDFFPALRSIQFWVTTTIDGLRCMIAGGVCLAVGWALTRAFLRSDIADAIEQAPVRLRRPARMIMLLPEPVESN